MNNFFQWLIKSSADPTRIALTIKGAVVFIPTFLVFTQVFGWKSLDQATLTELINDIAVFVSGIFMVYGLGRKIYLTFKAV